MYYSREFKGLAIPHTLDGEKIKACLDNAFLKETKQEDGYVKMTYHIRKYYFINDFFPEDYDTIDGVALQINLPNGNLSARDAECFIAPMWRNNDYVYGNFREYEFDNLSDKKELVSRGLYFLSYIA